MLVDVTVSGNDLASLTEIPNHRFQCGKAILYTNNLLIGWKDGNLAINNKTGRNPCSRVVKLSYICGQFV